MELEMNLNKEEFDQWLDMVEEAGRLPKNDIDKLRAMNKQRVIPLQCTRCGHRWKPRNGNPNVCPKCNSPYWNKQKIIKVDKDGKL